MQAGKLPLDFLGELLGKIDVTDPRVALGARPGEDAALIDKRAHHNLRLLIPVIRREWRYARFG